METSGKMNSQDFVITFSVDQDPEEAFDAISKVSSWWTENMEGRSRQLNDEFDVHFGEVHYSRQKLVEVVPGKKIVWLVTDSKLNFLADQHEWTNTRISFEVGKEGEKTQVRFTHIGLIPAIECYGACTDAWSRFIKDSLQNFITTGKGKPTLKGQVF